MFLLKNLASKMLWQLFTWFGNVLFGHEHSGCNFSQTSRANLGALTETPGESQATSGITTPSAAQSQPSGDNSWDLLLYVKWGPSTRSNNSTTSQERQGSHTPMQIITSVDKTNDIRVILDWLKIEGVIYNTEDEIYESFMTYLLKQIHIFRLTNYLQYVCISTLTTTADLMEIM